MSDVWLIRHGQAGEVMGDYDRLSDLGFQQSRLAGEQWRHLAPIHAVVSGDMRRHRETEETFRAAFGLAGALAGRDSVILSACFGLALLPFWALDTVNAAASRPAGSRMVNSFIFMF